MKVRKKPVEVEAVQWTGSNALEIQMFVGRDLEVSIPPRSMEFYHDMPNESYTIIIPTLEGNMKAIKTDWIIKGVNGEFYPCKADIFEKTYEVFEIEVGYIE